MCCGIQLLLLLPLLSGGTWRGDREGRWRCILWVASGFAEVGRNCAATTASQLARAMGL